MAETKANSGAELIEFLPCMHVDLQLTDEQKAQLKASTRQADYSYLIVQFAFANRVARLENGTLVIGAPDKADPLQPDVRD